MLGVSSDDACEAVTSEREVSRINCIDYGGRFLFKISSCQAVPSEQDFHRIAHRGREPIR
jgi:hypothetical protein